MIPMYRYDNMACMDYMDPDVRCPKKAVKLNNSLTHSLILVHFWHIMAILEGWVRDGKLRMVFGSSPKDLSSPGTMLAVEMIYKVLDM